MHTLTHDYGDFTLESVLIKILNIVKYYKDLLSFSR